MNCPGKTLSGSYKLKLWEDCKMKKWKKAVAMLTCMSMVFLSGMQVKAENEDNSLGVVFSGTLDKTELKKSNQDQTVTLLMRASDAVTMDGMGLTIVWDAPLKLEAITGGESRINLTGADYNLANGKVGWQTDDSENISDVTDMLQATFTVPAGTEAGTYHVGMKDFELTRDYGMVEWEGSATVDAALTVTDDTAAGYTAGLRTLSESVAVDDTVTADVIVSHSSEQIFAAGEIVVQYDSSKLAFEKGNSSLGNATVEDTEGTIKLEDYGTDKNLGDAVYSLAFKAVANGDANITLQSAAFVNKDHAVKSDLIPATLSTAQLDLNINKKTFSVTLPDIFTGSSTITDGEDYTFAVADGDNYDYVAISATVNGEPVSVRDNGDGTYTVSNVTGSLVIMGSRTEKTYQVTYSGNAAEDITDGSSTATYNKDYTFTMPSADGWAYSLEAIKIGGSTYTGYTVENRVYTIPGTAITGDIEIIVTKSTTKSSVTVEGSGAGAAAGYDPIAEIGKAYTLTLVPEKGYTYTVSATMSGSETTVTDNKDNTYTIQKVTGNVVFTVERAVIADGVRVDEYLTLDGTKMWIVKNEIELAEGKISTYDGQPMLWSEKYNAYCSLVIAETLTLDDAKEKIDIESGTATEVDYGMDVNKTGKVDASDAQLAYNMYNAVYNEFTEDVSMEKFLRADVNGDAKVNVEDAAAIINSLFS